MHNRQLCFAAVSCVCREKLRKEGNLGVQHVSPCVAPTAAAACSGEERRFGWIHDDLGAQHRRLEDGGVNRERIVRRVTEGGALNDEVVGSRGIDVRDDVDPLNGTSQGMCTRFGAVEHEDSSIVPDERVCNGSSSATGPEQEAGTILVEEGRVLCEQSLKETPAIEVVADKFAALTPHAIHSAHSKSLVRQTIAELGHRLLVRFGDNHSVKITHCEQTAHSRFQAVGGNVERN